MGIAAFVVVAVGLGWFLLRDSGIHKYKSDIEEICLYILKSPNSAFVYYGMDEYIASLHNLDRDDVDYQVKEQIIVRMKDILIALVLIDLKAKKYSDKDIGYIFTSEETKELLLKWINTMFSNIYEKDGMLASHYISSKD